MSYTFLLDAGEESSAGMLLGHRPVCAVEIDAHCRRILLQRQRDGILPRFPIWDDVRTFDGRPWRGRAQLVAAGFPCQDIAPGSSTRTGIEGERSGLWREARRVVCEVEPRYVLVENSAALVAFGLGRVLSDLAALGYDARWGVFSGGDVGARHERERLFLLACRDGFVCPPRPWIERQSGELEDEKIHRRAHDQDIEDAFVAMAQEHARMDDGISYPVDSVRAIGNAQIPAVVALAWRTLFPN